MADPNDLPELTGLSQEGPSPKWIAEPRDRLRFLAVVAIGLVSSALEALLLITIVPVARSLVTNDNVFEPVGPLAGLADTPNRALILAALAGLGSIGSRTLTALAQARTIAGWEHRLRQRLSEAYFGAPLSEQLQRRPEHMIELWSNAVTQSGVGLTAYLSRAQAGVAVLLLTGASFWLDARSALVVVVIGVALLAVTRPLGRLARRASGQMAENSLASSEVVGELAEAALEVKAFDVAEPVLEKVDQRASLQSRYRRRTLFLAIAAPSIYQGLALLALVGVLAVARGQSPDSAETLGAVALLLMRTISYAQQMQSATQRITIARPFHESVHAWIGTNPPEAQLEAQQDGVTLDEIEFVGVGYDHPGTTNHALESIDLRLTGPGLVGLIGSSGSGKTTLAELLLQLRLPTRGHLLMNGHRATAENAATWFRSMAMVPQKARILHGTVRENVTFFREMSDDAIWEALEQAGLGDFVRSLPHGLDQQIGARERAFSGGQSQRLAIARAIVGGPEVLVLDEPTSALDALLEESINTTLRALADTRLVVVISHRTSILPLCDHVALMANGRLRAYGRPAEVALIADTDPVIPTSPTEQGTNPRVRS